MSHSLLGYKNHFDFFPAGKFTFSKSVILFLKRKKIGMNTISKIQKAITHLKADELAKFRRWYEKFDAKSWDDQFERDISAGNLDRIAEKAVEDYRACKSTEL
jgi:hypothetical protein